MTAFDTWGPLSEWDRTRVLDCDGLVHEPDQVLHRAIDVAAPAAVTWRWLCQLRVAPYSYDWVDNLGRRSPRVLTPDADDLATGQRINAIFRVTSFDDGRSITMRTTTNRICDVACTCVVDPRTAERSRLVVRFAVDHACGVLGWATARVLPAGDLVMMRRQLRTLAALAEANARDRGH